MLRGGGNVLFDCQMGDAARGFDFGTAYIVWMLQVVEKDAAFEPVDVGLLGVRGMVLEPDGVTDTSTSSAQAW